jgi:hypothetical protein
LVTTPEIVRQRRKETSHNGRAQSLHGGRGLARSVIELASAAGGFVLRPGELEEAALLCLNRGAALMEELTHLQIRLPERVRGERRAPLGITDLRERVREEGDRLLGALRALHLRRQAGAYLVQKLEELAALSDGHVTELLVQLVERARELLIVDVALRGSMSERSEEVDGRSSAARELAQLVE